MPDSARPAVFLDRDGVINAELGYVHRPVDFHFLPGVLAGLQQLVAAGYALVVVTNQAGIAKGMYGEQEYLQVTAHMARLLALEGIQLDGVYHCPHHPQGLVPALRIDCDCRKPAPGMIKRAAAELGLDLGRSALVGDKLSDVAAGRTAGVGATVLVDSGHALPADTGAFADHRCRDLAQAVAWILADGPKSRSLELQ